MNALLSGRLDKCFYEKPYGEHLVVHQLFESQTEKFPNSIAVKCGRQSITYEELNKRANQLAQFILANYAIKADQFIAIHLSRSIEMIIAILAVLKAGAAYIPIDTSYPNERKAYMVQNADARLILGVSGDKFQSDTIAKLNIDQISIDDINTENLPPLASSKNRIYLLYTSGSTGNPKGAGLYHYGVVNLLDWYVGSYEMNSSDRNLVFSSFGFDLTQKNILSALITGATLVLLDSEYDPLKIINTIKQEKITLINCTPSAFYPLLESSSTIKELSSLRYIFLGGEKINCSRLNSLLHLYPKTKLVNTYGPTECSDIACAYTLTESDIQENKDVPLGNPIQNVRVLILNENLGALKSPEIGEIYLAGIGIGEGYLNQKKLTEERFIKKIPDGLSYLNIKCLYRTGDLGYWREDGAIQYVGRIDDQVKLRGQRIELSEIDCLIQQVPEVRQATTVLVSQNNTEMLVSFYIAESGKFDPSEIEKLLALKLPKYMIPNRFIQLESFPLTPNAKIDKHKLREMALQTKEKEIIKARNYVEQALIEIWADVLQVAESEISIHDDFFELGGYSILATKVNLRLSKLFNQDFPIQWFFDKFTISNLAARIMAYSSQLPAQTVSKQSLTKAPLTPEQRRLAFLSELLPESPFYNLPIAYTVKGCLDLTAFSLAIEQLVQRHQALRICLKKSEAGLIEQVDSKSINIDFVYKLKDLSGFGLEQAKSIALSEIHELANTSFKLFNGPLWSVRLYCLPDKENILFLNFHHIIFDGWSWDIFKNELVKAYNANNVSLPINFESFTYDFFDYAVYRNQEAVSERAIDYWKQLLNSRDSMNLPRNHILPIPGFKGRRVVCSFAKDAFLNLANITKKYHLTSFNIFYSAFNLLCYVIGYGKSQLINVPVANRTITDCEGLIGFFVKNILVSSNLELKQSLIDFLKSNHSSITQAFSQAEISFEHIVEAINPQRNIYQNPISPVFFAFQNMTEAPLNLSGVKVEFLELNFEFSRFDLEWQVWMEDQSYRLEVFYREDVFDKEFIMSALKIYEYFIKQITTRPMQSLSEVIYNAAEYVHANYSIPLISDIAAQPTQNIAISYGDQCITYAELLSKISLYSVNLYNYGVRQGEIVPFLIEDPLESLLVCLALINIQATFLPLNGQWPIKRIKQILEECGSSHYITDSPLECEKNWIPVDNLSQQSAVESRIPAIVLKNPVAYVLYTSGSTGKPKGVCITLDALMQTFKSLQNRLSFSENDIFANITPLSFDISLLENIFPLTIGAQVRLYSREVTRNPSILVNELGKFKTTVIQATPTLWQILIDMGWRGDKEQILLSGGEVLQPRLAEILLNYGRQVWNLYGPTETCIWASAKLIQDCKNINLGKPLEHLDFTLLDVNEGELYISGNSLSIGYLLDNSLNAAYFIEKDGKRYYRTGDIVRKVGDEWQFLGRADRVLKWHGYRISLQEIENSLMTYPMVKEAVVSIEEGQLIAHIVKHNESVNTSDNASLTAWQETYDSVYTSEKNHAFPGWRYDNRMPIHVDVMNLWLNDVAEKISALQPQSILEIGCGIGQLASKLNKNAKNYIATDCSEEAVKHVEQNMPGIKVFKLFAHEIESNLKTSEVDLVILNSVVQYFPSLSYFAEVMRQISDILKPGGYIFLGDLKYPLLEKSFSNFEMAFSKEFFDNLSGYEIQILPKPRDVILGFGFERYDVIFKKIGHAAINVEEMLARASLCQQPDSANLISQEIRSRLSEDLPAYMLPSCLLFHEKLPVNLHYKVLQKGYKERIINQDVTKKLESIWRGVLQIDCIDKTASFFDQGGHSFAVLNLLSQIKYYFNIEIPLANFYQNPVFSTLIEYINSADDKARKGLQLLNKPLYQAIICIHPIDGSAEWYKPLAEKLNGLITVYAVQSQAKFMNINESAVAYLELLNKEVSEDIVAIIGWSYGAQIAFEMVKKLEASGKTVKLFVIDPPSMGCNISRIEKELQQSMMYNSDNEEILKLRMKAMSEYYPDGQINMLHAIFAKGTTDSRWGNTAKHIIIEELEENHYSIISCQALVDIIARMQGDIRQELEGVA